MGKQGTTVRAQGRKGYAASSATTRYLIDPRARYMVTDRAFTDGVCTAIDNFDGLEFITRQQAAHAGRCDGEGYPGKVEAGEGHSFELTSLPAHGNTSTPRKCSRQRRSPGSLSVIARAPRGSWQSYFFTCPSRGPSPRRFRLATRSSRILANTSLVSATSARSRRGSRGSSR